MNACLLEQLNAIPTVWSVALDSYP
jgi:hypothetical protein